jgi:hypothetical protein
MQTDKTIIDDALEQQRKKVDEIVKAAFEHHFGFPLTDVKDTDNLEHLIPPEGQGIESLLYRGETFMYISRTEIEVDPFLKKPAWPQIKAITRYIEV